MITYNKIPYYLFWLQYQPRLNVKYTTADMSDFPSFDLYSELGVAPNASKQVIIKAWKDLQRTAHPDKQKSEAGKLKATELSARVSSRLLHHFFTVVFAHRLILLENSLMLQSKYFATRSRDKSTMSIVKESD